ncbi:substrate-binding domain-containing protein [Stenotrophomonas sp. 24(2023)]|uniref:substrate-binding domain-containing protein n=1 Tax=Stenotrophomonas sp. 24(2023) TaxID=3068324 RepID=UPI0027E206AE|nr:substrate-binding domain-containing protein [Stenotrophomonas sp. 24(2023)]WMJ69397.1 substrate-binding domain-containing protein [Stenotrophomonas sp. 24(2023)]
MYKCKTLAALVATALLATVGAASAQTAVTGGGASLPADLYKGSSDSILPANFSYAVTGSGTGKKAFLENNAALFSTTGTVHFAGSDSVLSLTELNTYNSTYNVSGDANRYGPLIQVPSVATSVTIPFNKAGSAVDLSVTQICGIFSGKITNWNQVSSDRTGAIQVVYRPESSGTSELLTRFLTAACQNTDVAGTTLKLTGGVPKFSVQSTFANLFVNNTVPGNFLQATATGGTALYNTVYAADGRIGYVGPDVIPSLTDATKVAKVKGKSPDEVSVLATLDTIDPPTGDAALDPANWVPVFGNPSEGYPIAGYTNLVLGQCYKNATVASNLRTFLLSHYSSAGGSNTAIRAHGFIPLTQAWRDAIRNRFVLAGSSAGLNNPGACGSIGRPL